MSHVTALPCVSTLENAAWTWVGLGHWWTRPAECACARSLPRPVVLKHRGLHGQEALREVERGLVDALAARLLGLGVDDLQDREAEAEHEGHDHDGDDYDPAVLSGDPSMQSHPL